MVLHVLARIGNAVRDGRLKVVLASGSPRRKEILSTIFGEHLPYLVHASTFEENLDKSSFSAPEEYVIQTALGKAEEVFDKLRKDGEDLLIIACDTVVVQQSNILEKPKDEQHAKEVLRALSGKECRVVSGVVLKYSWENEPVTRVFSESTSVQFSEISEELLDAYVNSGEPMDKAGGFGYQGLAQTFISGIVGDYWNVVGLPSCALSKHLTEVFSSYLTSTDTP